VKIIDTHSHIYEPDFDNDIDTVISRSKQAGIEAILLPNIDRESAVRLHRLCENYTGYCYPMMGLHPTSVTAEWQSDLSEIKKYFSENQYVAIGEIGIDLYWDKSLEKEQRSAFEEQLRWSIKFNLPVAIHSRDAIAQCIECIKNVGAEKLRGVFHSFGGTEDELEAILELKNFLLGINGVVTFKNSNMAEVLRQTDLSNIIVETDSPYLAPVPYRGKRNESSYVVKVIEKLAEIYNITPAEVADVTTGNAKKLFQLNHYGINT